MCDQCQPPPAAPRGHITRRSILLLGAGSATGILIGLFSCRNETPPATTQIESPTLPSSTTNQQSAMPNPTATSSIENQTSKIENPPALPTPNLGSLVFPDPTDPAGRALAQPSDAPIIINPRIDWTTAGPHLNQIVPMKGIARLTVHHTGWQVTTDAWQPTANELENIREFHAGTRPADRQWADIAYHFAVDRAGRVWQARPLAYQGAHVKGHNEHNLGIVLLGNFEEQSPSAAQLTSLGAFILFLRRLYHIPLAEIFTHGELGQTSCPGKLLQAYMNRARHQWSTQESTPWFPPTRPATAPT